MKRNYLVRIVVSLCFLAFSTVLFNSCTDQVTQVCTTPPAGQTGFITGKVVSTGNNGVSGIIVSVDNNIVYTNNKGEFFMSKVPVGERVLINFSSPNHASTQKIVKVVANRTSFVDAAVLSVGIKHNLNAINGGTVSFSGAKVDFPANSLVDTKGNSYLGTAIVRATYFDPTQPTFYGCFPGEFNGVREDNSQTQIESFGFINVEISGNSEKLQLASGKSAAVTMPIPSKLQGKAPLTIPLWYYDEVKGMWIEEGVATKTGNNYVGSVKHFSSWNCDQPTQTSYLEGKVVDSNGDPVSFAVVHSEGVDYTGSSRVNTNDSGYFKIPVKSASTAKIWASYYFFQSTSQNITTPATGTIQDIGTITIAIDTTNICTIIGRVIDNGDQPVKSVYVNLLDSNGKAIDYVYSNSDGRFKFLSKLNTKYTISIKVHSYDSSQVSMTVDITTPSQSETIDLGDLKLDLGGSTVIGRVVDVNSNPLEFVYVSTPEVGSNSQRELMTDSTGKFSLWVRPNITFKVSFYSKVPQATKTIDVTSGILGETKDIGDFVIP